MPEDQYRYADVRTVFEDISGLLPQIELWSDDDLALNSSDLLETLSEVRRIIDKHLQIRKPHLEFNQ